MEADLILVTGSSGFIGTRLMNWCQANRLAAVGLDWRPPSAGLVSNHISCDINHRDHLAQAVKDASPTSIVHLAARTDLAGKTVEDYPANSIGVSNLLQAIRQVPSVKRCLFT